MTTSESVTTHTLTTENRPFGQGFGPYQVTLYSEEGPRTGPLLDAAFHTPIRDWAKDADNKAPITDIVPPSDLQNGLYNQLLHIDIPSLVNLLPDLLGHMSPETRRNLFRASTLATLPERTWRTMQETRPTQMPAELNTTALADYFKPLTADTLDSSSAERPGDYWLKKARRQPAPDLTLNGVGMESVASVLPQLFIGLSDKKRVQATAEIAAALHTFGEDKNFFGALGDPMHNRVTINSVPTNISSIYSNGRALQFEYQTPPDVKANPDKEATTVNFQGHTWQPVQFHFHRNKNISESGTLEASIQNEEGKPDGKMEFRVYHSKEHETSCRQGQERDPNADAVGELHAIFMREDPASRQKSALLLGAHVMLGAHNGGFDKYLDYLRGLRLNRSMEMGKKYNPSELAFDPFSCFNSGQGFHEENLPEAPFTSLNLGALEIDPSGKAVLTAKSSQVFYRGVGGVLLSKPITIDREQLRELQHLQEVLAVMDPKTYVAPLERGGAGGMRR